MSISVVNTNMAISFSLNVGLVMLVDMNIKIIVYLGKPLWWKADILVSMFARYVMVAESIKILFWN
jgi:hypothetical protein